MRRKLFCGIALFAMVFSTCMSGFAQTTTLNCMPCDKCTPWHIRAANCTVVDPQLGGGAPAVPFDWDATYGYCEQSGGTLPLYITPGYNNTNQRRCRAVLDICQCPDACDFEEGWVLGVQMAIVNEQGQPIPGVYFTSDPDVPLLNGTVPALTYVASASAFDNENDSTGATAMSRVCYSPNVYQLRFRRIPKIAATVPCTTMSMLDGVTANPESPDVNLGVRTAYDTMKVTYYTSAGVVTTQAANNATMLRTRTPYDAWELTEDDVRRQLCNFWFDVPAMIAGGTTMAQAGQHVYVKISLLASAPLAERFASLTAGELRDYLRPNNPDGATFPPVYDPEELRFLGTDYMYGAPPYESQGAYWEWSPCGLLAPNNPGCTTNAGFDADNDRVTTGDAAPSVADTNLIGTGACEWEWDQSFCPDCASPCSCTIDVGILCCTDTPVASTYCLTFPYVLQHQDNWETGIGLSRLCLPATGVTPQVTFRLTDCTGRTMVHTINPSAADENLSCIFLDNNGNLLNGGMLVTWMVDWWPEFANAAPGQGTLRVESNFRLGGYQFNLFDDGTGTFGAGVLPWVGCDQSCQLQ